MGKNMKKNLANKALSSNTNLAPITTVKRMWMILFTKLKRSKHLFKPTSQNIKNTFWRITMRMILSTKLKPKLIKHLFKQASQNIKNTFWRTIMRMIQSTKLKLIKHLYKPASQNTKNTF